MPLYRCTAAPACRKETPHRVFLPSLTVDRSSACTLRLFFRVHPTAALSVSAREPRLPAALALPEKRNTRPVLCVRPLRCLSESAGSHSAHPPSAPIHRPYRGARPSAARSKIVCPQGRKPFSFAPAKKGGRSPLRPSAIFVFVGFFHVLRPAAAGVVFLAEILPKKFTVRRFPLPREGRAAFFSCS